MYQNLAVLDHEESKNSHDSLDKKNHLQTAIEYSRQSVKLFDNYFESSNDTSTKVEHTFSMQVLAASLCSAKKFEEGTEIWGKTIKKARDATEGLKVGIMYENVATVLFNAAVCYAEANFFDDSRTLAEESAKISRDLVQLAHPSSLDGNQKTSLQNNTPLLKAAESLLASIGQIVNHNQNSEINGGTDEERMLRKVMDKNGQERYFGATAFGGTDDGSFDTEEWEECEDDDPDCSSFYVVDDETEVDSSSEESIYEGLSEDEIEELRFIRERYARQTTHKHLNNDVKDAESSNVVKASKMTRSAKEQLELEIADIKGYMQTLANRVVSYKVYEMFYIFDNCCLCLLQDDLERKLKLFR